MPAAVDQWSTSTESPSLNHIAATHAQAVTTSDTVDLTNVSRGLFVGGAGNVVVIMADGTTVTITGVTAGTLLPIRVSRVKATGTTATNMVALS